MNDKQTLSENTFYVIYDNKTGFYYSDEEDYWEGYYCPYTLQVKNTIRFSSLDAAKESLGLTIDDISTYDKNSTLEQLQKEIVIKKIIEKEILVKSLVQEIEVVTV